MRLLAGLDDAGYLDLAGHQRVHGPMTARSGLIDELNRSGLTGRGGGAFPLARKMRAVHRARGRPVVVVNGAESEPAADKDHFLLSRAPHLVLDGAEAAAGALGARDVVVWTHRGDRVTGERLAAAVAERPGRRRTRVVAGPDRYVAGEASAIVHHLSGGPALPTMSPYRTAERGVRGRPTLLANAETFAHLALVARHGAAWFRSAGTADEPGTMLATVRGAVRDTGVVEVPVGLPLVALLARAGGPTGAVGCFLIGGYGGSWLPAQAAEVAALSRSSMAAHGVDLGVGLVVAMPADRCPVAETARLLGWLASESTGQCGPCINGLPAIAAGFLDLAAGRGGVDGLDRLHRWAGMVAGRGACHHPDGAVRLLLSTLSVHGDHLRDHLRHGPCPDLASSPVCPLPPPGLPTTGAERWR
jgi:NADH:ubiquinone oxidoreductase subunit F (NADH-binding)